MIKEALDNKNFRIVFSVLIGVPATLTFIVGLVYGVVIANGIFHHFEWWAASLALATALGGFGIIGAWMRLIKTSEALKSKQLKFAEFSLACGVIASIILLGHAILANSLFFGLPLLVLTAGGIVFYVGT